VSHDRQTAAFALRLALARCAGHEDAYLDTADELADADACPMCILHAVLTILAGIADADDIAWLEYRLIRLLDAADPY
jgi:hypothetical protein